MELEEHFDAAGIEAELNKCLASGHGTHAKFMREIAVRQFKATLITNQLLERLITQEVASVRHSVRCEYTAHNSKDASGGCY